MRIRGMDAIIYHYSLKAQNKYPKIPFKLKPFLIN